MGLSLTALGIVSATRYMNAKIFNCKQWYQLITVEVLITPSWDAGSVPMWTQDWLEAWKEEEEKYSYSMTIHTILGHSSKNTRAKVGKDLEKSWEQAFARTWRDACAGFVDDRRDNLKEEMEVFFLLLGPPHSACDWLRTASVARWRWQSINLLLIRNASCILKWMCRSLHYLASR